MQLQILRSDDAVTHVALAGRLDIAGAQDVQDRFTFAIAPRHKPTIVDLSQVTFLASMGMALLVSVAKALRPAGVPLILCGPIDLVHRSLVAAGMQHLMTIVATPDEAMRCIEQPPR